MTRPPRTRLDDQLSRHRPADRRERAAVARMRAELQRLERPFDEQADPVHVTGSAVVVGARGILLHRHKRLGIWLQPGGHLDPGESPLQAALRETREETGLAARPVSDPAGILHVDVHDAARGHVHLDVRYLLAAPDDDPVPPPHESQAVAWFALPEARRRADAGLIGALDHPALSDHLARLGHRVR